jgi:N-acetylneuraminic acid mutarotase
MRRLRVFRGPVGGARVSVVASSWERSAARGLLFALALFLVVPIAFAGSASSRTEPVTSRGWAATMPTAGTWRRLPRAPIAPSSNVVSVWTGRKMLIFGRAQPNSPWSVDVAAAYDPATRRWLRLEPSPGPKGNFEGRYWAVWTGKKMLVFGPFDFQAFNPSTNRWRRLAAERGGGAGGLVVWTGREMIDWGGGCCGDASSAGGAYRPTTNTWRKLSRSPLAPSQQPIGAWTGRELIVLVSGVDPDGKPYPASLARAAAYSPASNTWRRIAPLPTRRQGAIAVWDGHELLVVGGAGAPRAGKPAPLARIGFAYTPATNRWRRLPPMASGRTNFAAVWSGKRLLIWGGRTSPDVATPVIPSRGLAYDALADSWSSLPQGPLVGRLGPTAVWTGRAMIVWGGSRPKVPLGTGTRSLADGAAYRPTRP